MKHALELAQEGLGRVAPNPSVGCVLVKNNTILAGARTSDGGRPHGEANALDIAGSKACGATAYVTLEPCWHPDCPSCSSKLIDAGVVRVVVGCLDENPLIHGKGIAALRSAGILVEIGCLEPECREINRGFFLSKTEGRPLITLKTAMSLDSKIATSSGQSRWITADESRCFVHGLRASHDAILTGIGTVLADDPELTTRIDGVTHKAVRVVLDSSLRMPVTAKMLKIKNERDLFVFTNENADTPKAVQLKEAGAHVVSSPIGLNGKIELGFVLNTLAKNGITRLMVEGGQKILTSFVQSGLWDDLYILRAPMILGADGYDAFGAMEISALSCAVRPVFVSRHTLGPDLAELYKRSG